MIRDYDDIENEFNEDNSIILEPNITRMIGDVEPIKKPKKSNKIKQVQVVQIAQSFWKNPDVPKEFKNYVHALMKASEAGDTTKVIYYVNKLYTKFSKDTSMTDYLMCLFRPDMFYAPMPTIFKSKQVLVPFTQEVTLQSNAAISIHWNVGMWNSANANNIYTNIVNNGNIPDVTAADYIAAGSQLPNYYGSLLPVAAILKITPEGNDFNENGRIYITSTFDETVRIETPISYSNYTVPGGYVNQFYKYAGHPKKGAFAIYFPQTDRMMTYQQIVGTSAASLLNGALLETLMVGTANVPLVASFSIVCMMKPLPLQTPYLGVNTAKPGKPPQAFDLGSVAGDHPQLICGSLDSLERPERLREVNEAIMNIPGIETDDFWTGLAKLGLIALNAVPQIIEGFTK